MKPSTSESMLIEAPCRLEAVRDAARVLRSFLAANGAVEAELNDWELVTVEAGNNAVQYAPSGKQDSGVRFLMNAWPDSVELCVTDHSSGFELPSETPLPADDSEHGRGLFLMSALTDSVRYVRGRRENFLILRKQRSARRPMTDVQRDTDLETTLQLMTEELGASYESLSTIFRFSSELGKAGDIRECAAKWLHELMKVTQTEWHVLRQFNDDSGRLEMLASSHAFAGGEAPPPSLATRGVEQPCAEVSAVLTGREVWFDAASPAHLTVTLESSFGTPVSGVAYPIFVGRELFGVLTIGVRKARTDFSAGSINVMHTFADFLGIQLTNEDRLQESVQARLTNREMQVAAGIQRSLLPRDLPRLDGCSLTAWSQSARAVGGDFYDVLPVKPGGALFAIADVMGKGVPAAMFAAIFRSHLRSRLDLVSTPGKMMAWLNRVLFADLDGVDMFVTAQLAYLDLTTQTLTVTSAGHCPALLVEAGPKAYREIGGDGPPLGISREAVFAEETIQPVAPYHLLMLTDGLYEVRDPGGRLLGQTSVAACFADIAQRTQDAEAVRDTLLSLVARHQDGTPATDDVTLVLLVNHGPENAQKNNTVIP